MSLSQRQGEALSEYSGLLDRPEDSLYNLANGRYCGDIKTSFVIFSDPVAVGYGRRLRDYILQIGAGKVVTSEIYVNGNTQRQLEIFIFTPNDTVLKAWFYKLYQKYVEAQKKYQADCQTAWNNRTPRPNPVYPHHLVEEREAFSPSEEERTEEVGDGTQHQNRAGHEPRDVGTVILVFVGIVTIVYGLVSVVVELNRLLNS